jgi:electron transport complex protein RnfD
MVDVIVGLAPVLLAAVWYFGLSAIVVVVASVLGAMATEWALPPSGPRGESLKDGSAALTGVLVRLTLPHGIAAWMPFLGGVAAIGLGKLIFGGLGQNLFNPALAGRAFLQAAFPTAITTWSAPGSGDILAVRASNFALPFMQSPVDAVTTATPLGLMKFEQKTTAFSQLLLGSTAGSLGETCGLVIILCGVFLAFRRTFDWRIPIAVLASVAAFSGIFWLLLDGYPSPVFMLCSGGLLFGAVYMATDPVTSPIAPRGAWVYGMGIGLLVVMIRLWGGLPEGVMYAILLMNGATPLIERIDQPRAFGRTEKGATAA